MCYSSEVYTDRFPVKTTSRHRQAQMHMHGESLPRLQTDKDRQSDTDGLRDLDVQHLGAHNLLGTEDQVCRSDDYTNTN